MMKKQTEKKQTSGLPIKVLHLCVKQWPAAVPVILGFLSVASVDLYTCTSTCTTPTSMASTTPFYYCPCFRCQSEKLVTKKTIKRYLRQNEAQLQDLIARGGNQQLIDFLQSSFDQTTELLARISGEYHSSSQSPDPDGVYLFFYAFIIN